MKILTYDRLFHQKLIENYPNKSAKKIIESLRIKIYLYDFGFWNEQQKMDSAAMHSDIINFLSAKDIPAAIDLIYQNWMQAIEYIRNRQKSNSDQ